MRRAVIGSAILAIIAFTILSEAQRGTSEAYRYEAKGKRDPFVPLLGQGKTSALPDLVDVITIEDLRLQGIASGPRGEMVAFLNGELVKKGVAVGIVEIVAVDAKSVTLLIGGTEYTIGLPEETGGE